MTAFWVQHCMVKGDFVKAIVQTVSKKASLMSEMHMAKQM